MGLSKEAAPRALNTGATANGKAIPMTPEAYSERHPDTGSTASPQPVLFDVAASGEIEPVSPIAEPGSALARTNANEPQSHALERPASSEIGAHTVPQPNHSPAAVERRPRRHRRREGCEDCTNCAYCEAGLSSRHEHDHFPIPESMGGTETIPVCLNCHDLKDRVPLGEWPWEMFTAAVMDMTMGPPRLLVAKLLTTVLREYERKQAA